MTTRLIALITTALLLSACINGSDQVSGAAADEVSEPIGNGTDDTDPTLLPPDSSVDPELPDSPVAAYLGEPETVGMSSAALDRLVDEFRAVLDDGMTGGIQMLVARRGTVVLYENLGWADIEAQSPVTDQTLFRIVSMTKPVVGVAMMMLHEEGVYSLDDPVHLHIPEFAGLRVMVGQNPDGSPILEDLVRPPTILDLMRHTAGFTNGLNGTLVDQMYIEDGIGSYDDTLQQFIDKLAATPLVHQPGETWLYSMSVDVQGYLIEKWTGMTLENFLRDRLFDPLGMDQTLAWVPATQASQLAHVYTHDSDGQLIRDQSDFSLQHYRPPGGFSGGTQLISTADDYWRFIQMLLDGGRFDGKVFLSPHAIDLMASDQLPPTGEDTKGRGFGLNFAVITDASRVDYPVSNGEYYWAGAATTVFWIDPELELVAVLLTQYLPTAAPYYNELFHRLIHDAIVDR